jgi:hypothetical protein
LEENKKLLVGTDLSEVVCPLMNGTIDYGVCFDIHMVVAGEAPLWTAPSKATGVPDFKNICLKCKYHRFD